MFFATRKRTKNGRLLGLLASLPLALMMTGALAIEVIPVYLKETFPPNIAFTVDDSGSMAWGYFPDNLGGQTDPRFTSAAFNPLAYDPTVTYTPATLADGTTLSTTFNAARQFAYINDTTIDLATSYSPTVELWINRGGIGTADYTWANRLTFFVGAQTALQPIGPAFYYRLRSAPAINCPTIDVTLDACHEPVVVGAGSGVGGTDERDNFANWYAFYRTRNLVVKTGLLTALYDLDPAVRITFQDLQGSCVFPINGVSCANPTGTAFANQLQPFTAAHRAATFAWIQSIGTVGGTPLRAAFERAHNYFSATGPNNPWGTTPGTTEAPTQACRLSYHVALTDGAWNGGLTNVGNVDDASIDVPRTEGDNTDVRYNGRRPYRDSTSNTLADLAFRSWVTDLQPINNESPAFLDSSAFTAAAPAPGGKSVTWPAAVYWDPRHDPASWQHLVTFTIGLGLGRGLTNPRWAGSTYATFPASDPSFPNQGYAQIADGTVAWPAATDGSANNVYDLWHAAINGRGQFYSADKPQDVTNAFQDILARISGRTGSAGGVAASSGFAVGATLIYHTAFSTSGWYGEVSAQNILANGDIGTEAWTTDTTLLGTAANFATNRNIWVRNLDSAASVTRFVWADVKTATKTALNNDSNLLAYLRGDRTKELGSATCLSGCTYRARVKLLGDILGSAPVLSGHQDFGYKDAIWASINVRKAYQTYLTTKKARTPLLLVGANDGMLHAFDGNNGDEKFAFIPRIVVPTLKNLGAAVYVKRAFVDGPITVGDAFLGGAWKTYAVISMGPGGKSVVGLDVTDPSSLSGSTVKWEFTDTDLGFVLSRPVIQRLQDGTWAAIFSGGYENPTHSGALFVVNLENGALLSKTTMPTPLTNGCGSNVSTSSTAPGGLGAIRAFTGKDGAVVVYAGDLLGNLWSFKQVTGGAGLAQVKKVFAACNASQQPQPITAAPAVTSVGVQPMIFVGTGRLFATGDIASLRAQSFYAVIDDDQTTAYTRADLGARLITLTSANNRFFSENSINLALKRGWYIDLPADGERLVSSPIILDGRVAFTSLKPRSENCESKGESWLFNLDALSGRAPNADKPIFDVDGNGTVNQSDVVTDSGVRKAAGARAVDATIGGITAVRTVVSPDATGASQAAGRCRKGDISLLTSNLYKAGVAQNCAPGQFMRSGWTQLR